MSLIRRVVTNHHVKTYESSGISDYFVDNPLVIDNMFGDVDADINDDVMLVGFDLRYPSALSEEIDDKTNKKVEKLYGFLLMMMVKVTQFPSMWCLFLLILLLLLFLLV